jgi:hypothetical protein
MRLITVITAIREADFRICPLTVNRRLLRR